MWLIFGLALLPRLIYALSKAEVVSVNDMGVYNQLAMSLLDGNGYTSALEPHFVAFRAPGYAFFLAGIYAIFGDGILPVIFFQCVMGALTCVWIYRIAVGCFDERTGLLAAAICVCDIQMIHWSSKVLTETLFVCLVALFVHLCVRLRLDWQNRTLVLAGLSLGAANLVRPSLLAFMPVLFLLLLLWSHGSIVKRVVRAAAPIVIAMLVLLPWTVRNYRALGEVVPVATIGGIALFVALPLGPQGPNLPPALAVWRRLEDGMHRLPNGYDLLPELFRRPPKHVMPRNFSEVQQSNRGREIYLRYASRDPERFARLVATKASLLFNPLPKRYYLQSHEDYGFPRHNTFVRYASALFIFSTFLFGSLGLITSFSWRGPQMLPALIVAFHIALQLIFRPAHRYFLPGLVVATIFSAAGLLALPRLRERLVAGGVRPRAELGLWVVAASALFANTWYQVAILRGGQVARDFKVMRIVLGLN